MKFSKIKKIGNKAGQLAQTIRTNGSQYMVLPAGVVGASIDSSQEKEELKKLIEAIGLKQKPKMYNAFAKAFVQGAWEKYQESHVHLESASLLDILRLFPQEKWNTILSVTQLENAVVSCHFGEGAIRLSDAVAYIREHSGHANAWEIGEYGKTIDGIGYWEANGIC